MENNMIKFLFQTSILVFLVISSSLAKQAEFSGEETKDNYAVNSSTIIGDAESGLKSSSVPVIDGVDAHHRQPRINPVNPKLVAYEYRGNIRIVDKTRNNNLVFEIECEDVESDDFQIGGLFEEIPEAEDLSKDGFNCVHFDWRPVLDQRGNFWFSYVSLDDNNLNIGFINNDGRCGEVFDYERGRTIEYECDVFPVYRANQSVFRPKWSPDGQYLIFNDGRELKISNQLYNQLRKKEYEDFDPTPLTNHAYFAEWSPDGRYIAFEYNNPANQARTGLYLMDMKSETGARPENSIINIEEMIITRGASADGRFKPRWSDSGNYISYLIESYTENRWDVKVLEVLRDDNNPESTEITGFSSITGRVSRAFASDVSRGSEMRTGFPITTVTDGDGSIEVLLVIRADQEQNNPIRVYPIDRGVINQGVEGRARNISQTTQNDHLDVVFDGETTHIAYVSQERGSMRLQHMYINWKDGVLPQSRIQYPEVVNLPRELSRSGAMFRSAILPGWGHMYKGNTGRGFLHLGATAAVAGGIVYMISKNNSDVNSFNSLKAEGNFAESTPGISNYINGPNTIDNIETAFSNRWSDYQDLSNQRDIISRNNTLITVGAAALAGVYLYTIYDSRRGFPVLLDRNNNRTQLVVQPQVIPAFERDSFAAGLKFQLNLR